MERYFLILKNSFMLLLCTISYFTLFSDHLIFFSFSFFPLLPLPFFPPCSRPSGSFSSSSSPLSSPPPFPSSPPRSLSGPYALLPTSTPHHTRRLNCLASPSTYATAPTTGTCKPRCAPGRGSSVTPRETCGCSPDVTGTGVWSGPLCHGVSPGSFSRRISYRRRRKIEPRGFGFLN